MAIDHLEDTAGIIRVLAADDHPILRTGIRALLDYADGLTLVAEAANGADAVALYDLHRPDVVLMDLRMPHLNGVEAIRQIVAAHPEARIVALTSSEGDADVHRALDAGACGYLVKDALVTDVIDAIRTAAAGGPVIPPVIADRLAEFSPRVDLTPREVEVLKLASKGLRNHDIGRALARSEETVKVHLKHVMAKLGVAGRTEAVTQALRRGIIHLDDCVPEPSSIGD